MIKNRLKKILLKSGGSVVGTMRYFFESNIFSFHGRLRTIRLINNKINLMSDFIDTENNSLLIFKILGLAKDDITDFEFHFFAQLTHELRKLSQVQIMKT